MINDTSSASVDRRQSHLPVQARAPAPTRPLVERRAPPVSVSLSPAENDPSVATDVALVDYWRIVVKRRWTVIASFVIVFVVTLVATLMATPMFRSTTTLQIERDTMKVVNVSGLMPTEAPGDMDFYQTQYELLASRALAQRVVNQLNLAGDAVFERMMAPSPLGKLLGMLSPSKSENAKPSPESGRIARVGTLLANLSVEPVRNSRLARLHFESPDPAFSAAVANTFAESFIAMNLERRFDASSYAKTYLEERLQQLKLKLEDSERQLIGFAQLEGIVNTDDKQSLLSQQLQQINAALGEAENERIKSESRFRQIQASRSDALPEVLQSPVIGDLKKTQGQLLTDYQNKLGVFKPDYPAMQNMRSQIEQVGKQIEGEIANIKGGIVGNYQAAMGKERMLTQRLAELKVETLDLQGRSIQYNILKREVDTNRQLYDGLLQRYKEIGIAGGVGTNNVSVVDRAEVPTGRFRPRLTLNLAFATMIGLFLGVLLAFLFEHLDDTVKTPDDIERQLRLAVLGVVPIVRKGNPYEQLKDPRSAFSESYRSVRTALQFSTEKGVPRTLFVTSAVPGEGKSTTAVTLALHFSQLGKRVLLVDADLRNPSLHRALGLSNSAGLSNYLAGASRPLKSLRKTKVRNLAVLCSGPLPPNPAELLAGPKMLSLMALIGAKFDLVIIDGPPVLGIADSTILANLADGTLVVMESGATRLGYARGVMKRLITARARLLGVVLTKFDTRGAGYGYGNGYGYGDAGYYSYGSSAVKQIRKA